jgi:hypothetical protein
MTWNDTSSSTRGKVPFGAGKQTLGGAERGTTDHLRLWGGHRRATDATGTLTIYVLRGTGVCVMLVVRSTHRLCSAAPLVL